jgi:FG-GAP repeat
MSFRSAFQAFSALTLVVLPAAASPQALQAQKLVGSTLVAGSHFGRSVSISGNDLLAGTLWTGGQTKRAFAFVRAGSSWSEQAILSVPNFGAGLTVAIRGNLALLGAPATDGYAWRFERSGTSWSGPIPTNLFLGHDDWGSCVAIGDGPMLLIGAPQADSCGLNEAGILAAYCPNGTGWQFSFSLGDPSASCAGEREGFGSSVSTSGSRIAVGANGIDPEFGFSTGPGKALVFERDCSGGSGAPSAILTGPGPRFGESVALDGDALIVGQYGAAFAYAREGASWVAQGTLDAQDPLSGAQYGSAVALRGDIALVGDPTSSAAGAGSGAVYVFRRSGASWTRIQVLTGNDTLAGDRFGSALSVSDAWFAVGAPLADSTAADSGAVYVFELPLAPPHTYCSGKLNSQGCVPQIGFDGIPSASAPAVFDVSAIQELNQKTGLLLYGTSGIAAIPFQGGTLCIAAPLHRTGGQQSGGNPLPTSDCSGGYHYDFNARVQSGVDPGLLPGVRVAAQYWSRDPLDPFGTALSDALLFTVGP